jgi:hypothetical protein
VIELVKRGGMSIKAASKELKISCRQEKRIYAAYGRETKPSSIRMRVKGQTDGSVKRKRQWNCTGKNTGILGQLWRRRS